MAVARKTNLKGKTALWVFAILAAGLTPALQDLYGVVVVGDSTFYEAFLNILKSNRLPYAGTGLLMALVINFFFGIGEFYDNSSKKVFIQCTILSLLSVVLVFLMLPVCEILERDIIPKFEQPGNNDAETIAILLSRSFLIITCCLILACYLKYMIFFSQENKGDGL